MGFTGMTARVVVGGVVACMVASARPAGAVDISGVYASVHEIFSTPCTLTFVQTGSALTIDGPCQYGFPTNVVFELSGTVDELTGEFSTSGVLHGLCETPGSVTMIGTGDGLTFTAISACGTANAGISGSKCNNGMLDSVEDCEDGNTTAGDCCSPTCQFESAGSACAADTNLCTLDECDGAGACLHPANPAADGQPCTPDSNQCTDDVCNASGQCTHPNNSSPCTDGNPCTDPDLCTSGSCVGGSIAPECVGSIDLSGDWAITAENTFFAASPTRRFVQTGAVLESTDLATGMTGVGGVNPATGAFATQTPFVIIFFPCVEVITGTATMDAQEFTGTYTAYCGFEGNHGPFAVTGRRCDPVVGCICDVGECIGADQPTRVTAVAKATDVSVRWRWSHTPMTGPNFGDPTASTDYRLCLRTPEGNIVEEISHGENWRATRSGFRYKNMEGHVQRLLLRSSANQMSLIATAAPATPPSLPLTTPVTLRLIRLGPQPLCFEATFDDPIVNSPERFRAKE